MPLNVPDLAPILARIESIVYEQERRIDGGEPVGAPDTISNLTDEQLDEALLNDEEAACDLIDITRMNEHERTRARAYLHAALMDYADAVNHENRVVNPRDKARAVSDLARTTEYARAIIIYPRALDVFEALDRVEDAANRHRGAHDTDEHMTTLAEAVDAMRDVRHLGPEGADMERIEFVMTLGDYLSIQKAPVDFHQDTMLKVAAELDDTRAALAAAYVKALDAPKVSASGSV